MKLTKEKLQEILEDLKDTTLDNFVSTFDKYNIRIKGTNIAHKYMYAQRVYFYCSNADCLIFSVVLEKNDYIVEKLYKILNIGQIFDSINIDWSQVDRNFMEHIVGSYKIESNYFEESHENLKAELEMAQRRIKTLEADLDKKQQDYTRLGSFAQSLIDEMKKLEDELKKGEK